MKKTIILSLGAAALFCACQKSTPEIAEVTFTVGAEIENTKTAFIPDGKKVFWLTGDKIGLKYTKSNTGNDNVSLTLATGANTATGTFKGKMSATTNATPDGNVMVFYYPYVSTVAKSGSVTSKDDFVLGGSFPKSQNTNDVLFDPNLMYGFVTDVPSGWPTTTDSTCPIKVSMKNVMSVIDFTLKGTGSVKRVFITDLNTDALRMCGDYEVKVKNGVIDSFQGLSKAEEEYERTIIADFNKPIALSATGAHVYITVFPRTYSSGIEVGLEMTNGDYMTKKITTSFTTESNKVYTAPALTFASQKEAGKGIYENSIYTYKTFTDTRDNEVYRYITSGTTDWMIDNLRYIPNGLTPSSNKNEGNNGIWYPVILNEAGNGVTFGTDSASVARYGYLYNPSVALGKSALYIHDLQKAVLVDKTKTAAAALTELKAIANTGICPTGWHIPSESEYTTFYQACDQTLSGLGVIGFSLRGFGFFNVANVTATSDPSTGTPMTYASNKLNMTYMLLSTPNSYTQYKAAMADITNNTAKVAGTNNRSGIVVRCVRESDK